MRSAEGTDLVRGSEPDGPSEFRIGDCQLRMFFDIGTNLVPGNEVTCDGLNQRAGRGGMSLTKPFQPGSEPAPTWGQSLTGHRGKSERVGSNRRRARSDAPYHPRFIRVYPSISDHRNSCLGSRISAFGLQLQLFRSEKRSKIHQRGGAYRPNPPPLKLPPSLKLRRDKMAGQT